MGAGVGRLFITGVSPLVMDDVTSGFNIGRNISRMADFNGMVGLTRDDVTAILEEYKLFQLFLHLFLIHILIFLQYYHQFQKIELNVIF